MTDARWQRLWDLFHAALDEPADARAAFIASHCGDDAALADELRDLVAAHAADDNVLDRAPDAAALAVDVIAPGTTIGRWRVVRELGQGGMGRVYLVARDDGEYAHQAALKLLDPWLAHTRLVDGFLRERQILARLEHPRIARLLDGGRTAQGLPYLVMAYVDGVPIDRWCAMHAASFAQRVRLVATIAETVDFAHRHLVVHRDIKPGNVLVGTDGEPVLLDFGIAKNLAAGEGATLAGDVRPLTPRYAAPEQLDGGVVGIAADVYALGVLLYELVAGVPPHDTAGLGFADLARRIREHDPPPVRVAALRQSQRQRARGESSAVSSSLPAEIDAICRQALQADPQQRYRSAQAIADDLRAMLAHRPVAARPASVAYRARKFVRRRWPVVVAALAFVVMGVAFVWRLEAETRRTRDALADTRIERDRAAATASFLSALFREADTTQADGRVVPAREILDRGRAQLAARDDLPPATRAMLLNALAGVYRNMGATTTAAELLVEARALLPGIGSPALEAETLANLGAVWELEGRHRDARVVLERALALRRAQVPRDVAAELATAERFAVTLQSLGEREAAGTLFREAYDGTRANPGLPPAQRADAALRLGSWYWVAGRLDDAARHYDEALAARRAQQPADAPELARTLDGIGSLMHARGRYADAIAAFAEAIALRRRALGTAHRHTADSLSNLGAAQFDAGDDAAAEPALREALAIYATTLPADSPVLAKTLNNLGLVRQRQRDAVEARALFVRALAINRAAYGDDHARVAGNLNNIGLLDEDAGDLDAAAFAFAECAEILRRVLGPDHAQRGYALTNLARVRTFQHRFDDATTLFAQARAIRRAALPADHPAQAETSTWFAHLQCERGDAAAGVAMAREAMAIRAARGQRNTIGAWQTRAVLALCLVAAGEREAGVAMARGVRSPLAAARGADDRIVRRLDEVAR